VSDVDGVLLRQGAEFVSSAPCHLGLEPGIKLPEHKTGQLPAYNADS